MEKTPKKIANYTIIDTLGRGGMGVVYLVKDEINNDLCALKIISPEHLTNEDSTVRFRREFRAMQQLSHPNVVRVFNSGMVDQRLFFTMEVVKGIGVKNWLDQDSDLLPAKLKDPRAIETWPEDILSALNANVRLQKIYDLVMQISFALSAIHAHHIVHRDLKPDNILVSEAGVVKIMDFGIAKEASNEQEASSSAGMMIGTFKYISPEQALNSEQIDGRADLYSLGLIFYELLAGRHPFYSDTSVGYAFKHARAKPEKISTFNPYVNRDIEKIVLKLLRKDPSRRFRDAQQLIKTLKKVLDKMMSSSHKITRKRVDLNPKVVSNKRALLPPRLMAHKKESLKVLNMCERIKKGSKPVMFLIGGAERGKGYLLKDLVVKAKAIDVHVYIARVQQNSVYSLAPYTQLARQLLKKQSSLEGEKWRDFFSDEAHVLEYYLPELQPYLIKKSGGHKSSRRSHKHVLFHALSRLFRLATRNQSVLWVLDELDTADTLSLDFTLYFMFALLQLEAPEKSAGMIFVSKEQVTSFKGNSKTEIVEFALRSFAARSIELSQLRDQDIADFCGQMLAVKSFPLKVAAKISEICSADPRQVKEYLKACYAYDFLLVKKDQWFWLEPEAHSGTRKIIALDKVDKHALPSLKDLHSKHVGLIRSLREKQRGLLELIACYDGYLPVTLLEEIHLIEDDKLLDILNILLGKELIQENRDGSYNIPSVTLRTSLLQNIAQKQKQHLHQKIAFSLISLAEKTANQHSSAVIAHHLFAAGRVSLAIVQLKDAIKHALWNLTFENAKKLLLKAEKTLNKIDPEQQKLQHLYVDFAILKLDLIFRAGQDSQYLELSKKVYQEYWVVSQPQARIKILLHLARAYRHEGDLNLAIEKSHEALAIVEEHKLISYHCVLRRKLGDFYAQNGNVQRSTYHWQQALRFAENISEHEEINILKSHLALSQFEKGQLSEAERSLLELIENSVENKENFRTVDYSFSLAHVKLLQGNSKEAKGLLLEVLKDAKLARQKRIVGLSQLSLALILVNKGKKVAVDNYIKRSTDFFKLEKSRLVLCRGYLILARINYEQNNFEQLEDMAQQALKIAASHSDYLQKIEAQCYLAFLLAKKDKKTAILKLSQLIELSAQSQMIRIQQIAQMLKLHLLCADNLGGAKEFYKIEMQDACAFIKESCQKLINPPLSS